jgi:hypothetical protein
MENARMLAIARIRGGRIVRDAGGNRNGAGANQKAIRPGQNGKQGDKICPVAPQSISPILRPANQAICRDKIWEGMMIRQIKITDYGKDYGQGRYCMTVDDGRSDHDIKKIGTNDSDEISWAVNEWIGEKEDANLARIDTLVARINEQTEKIGRM